MHVADIQSNQTVRISAPSLLLSLVQLVNQSYKAILWKEHSVCVHSVNEVEILPSDSIQNGPECFRMFKNVPECSRMLQNNNAVS